MQCMEYSFGRYESQWRLTMRGHEAGLLNLVIVFWFPAFGLHRINLISEVVLSTNFL